MSNCFLPLEHVLKLSNYISFFFECVNFINYHSVFWYIFVTVLHVSSWEKLGNGVYFLEKCLSIFGIKIMIVLALLEKLPRKAIWFWDFFVEELRLWIQYFNKYWSNQTLYLFSFQPCIFQWIFLFFTNYKIEY